LPGAVHDPYFQYFTGEEFFQHKFPHERSDLSHWRNRLGDKLEPLVAEAAEERGRDRLQGHFRSCRSDAAVLDGDTLQDAIILARIIHEA